MYFKSTSSTIHSRVHGTFTLTRKYPLFLYLEGILYSDSILLLLRANFSSSPASRRTFWSHFSHWIAAVQPGGRRWTAHRDATTASTGGFRPYSSFPRGLVQHSGGGMAFRHVVVHILFDPLTETIFAFVPHQSRWCTKKQQQSEVSRLATRKQNHCHQDIQTQTLKNTHWKTHTFKKTHSKTHIHMSK